MKLITLILTEEDIQSLRHSLSIAKDEAKRELDIVTIERVLRAINKQ